MGEDGQGLFLDIEHAQIVEPGIGRERDVHQRRHGKVMRLRGLGQVDPFSGEAGDVMMTIKVKPDSRFTVDGNDLRTRVAVPLAKAVLGGPLHVPTLTGAVEMNIPPLTGT